MAIAFRADSITVGVSGTSVSAVRPTGTIYDDVMIAFVKASSLSGTTTITPPSGWTEIDTHEDGVRTYGIYWKRSAVSEPVSYVFTHDGDYARAYVVSYSGCRYASAPVDVYSNTAYVVDDKNVVAAAVTTTEADAMLVFLGAHSTEGVVTGGAASGMTERQDSSWGGGAYIYASEETQAVAGDSGTRTCVVDATNTSTVKHAFLVALAPATAGPVVALVEPTGEAIVQGLTPTLTFGTANPDSADVHAVLKVSTFPDFRTLAVDVDSSTSQTGWEDSADPFSTWDALASGGASAGDRVRYTVSESLRYDTYYALVWLHDSSHRGTPVAFEFVTSPDADADLVVTIGGVTMYPVDGACTITEETDGAVSVIDCDVNLAQYQANPWVKGDTIALASGIGGFGRTWNGTIESWQFDGSVVHTHSLQDDAYLSRKICTGDEASADVGQNLADFITSYGTPLTGTAIDTSTGVNSALTGGYKYLREHFSETLKLLPTYIYWVDDGGDVHLEDQSVMPVAYELYEEDPST